MCLYFHTPTNPSPMGTYSSPYISAPTGVLIARTGPRGTSASVFIPISRYRYKYASRYTEFTPHVAGVTDPLIWIRLPDIIVNYLHILIDLIEKYIHEWNTYKALDHCYVFIITLSYILINFMFFDCEKKESVECVYIDVLSSDKIAKSSITAVCKSC